MSYKIISRRSFLRLTSTASASLILAACSAYSTPPNPARESPIIKEVTVIVTPTEPTRTPKPSYTPSVTPDPTRGKPIVGAIRWDAWVGDLSDVGLMVEKTLAPQHWHYRLPFYAKKISSTQVQVRGATQEIMDQEIVYSSQAGLDYWAFVIYPEDNPLSLALKLYLNSAHKADLKFCLNLQGGWLGGPATWSAHVERYTRYFKEPPYQTVLGGRPLVYLFMAGEMTFADKFGSWEAAKKAIETLREAALSAGLQNPYLVIQDWSPAAAKLFVENLGADATSAYASDGRGKAAPFQDLALHTQRWWDVFRYTKTKVVPLVSSGWDPRPRIETKTPWVDYGSADYYYEPPAPQELADHLQAGIDWVRTYPDAAEANAILIYAWNECDEGGWLLPTLSEGTARLDAIQKVLKP